MSKSQTITGKAFEYACLQAFKNRLERAGKTVTAENTTDAYNTAQKAYDSLDSAAKAKYDLAAETAVKLVFPLEPMLENGSGTVLLSLNTDDKGKQGDVRDLLCVRLSDKWEIGISCKHNHEALKHPRITYEGNFAQDWLGYSCSETFLEQIQNITRTLDGNSIWKQIPNKQQAYYVPILELYMQEIEWLCQNYPETPARMLAYFFGTQDFYKIISQEKVRQTKIEGFNLHGSMNKPAGKIKPIYRVARLQMPTRLLDITRKNNTTIIIAFDGGWTIKMRLHNKDDIAKPTSLAWDVQLAGMPPELYQQQRSWDE